MNRKIDKTIQLDIESYCFQKKLMQSNLLRIRRNHWTWCECTQNTKIFYGAEMDAKIHHREGKRREEKTHSMATKR